MLSSVNKLFILFALLFTVACSSTGVESQGRSQESAGAESKEQIEVIYFDFDKYDIKPSERAKLDKQADKIKSENINSVVVEGHTDYLGTKEYNIALGERRANATKQYLVGKGVNAQSVRVVSYGKERPVDAAETNEAREKNRRTVTVFGK